MPTVKVWNDNRYPHTEKFKGETITIEPGGYVEMDYIDAVDFKGQFTPMKMLGPGHPDPQHFKMIRVDQPATPIVKEDKNVFHATGESFKSSAEVIAFAKAYAQMNPELAIKDSEAERSGGPTTAELLERIAALEAQVSRQKPSPKPKQKAIPA